MSQIDLLFQLQQLDQEIRTKKQRLSEVLRAQAETEELQTLRRQATESAESLQRARTAQRDLELTEGALAEKIRQSEERLYSGLVKNSRELGDLQAGVVALRRQQAALEEKSLEGLLNLDELHQRQAEAEAKWQAFWATWNTQQAQLRVEQNALALSLSALLDQRQGCAGRLDPGLLAQYDQISRKRGGVAVVQLRQNMCLGCRVTIPSNTVKAAHEGKIVYCTNCDRILKP